MSSTPPDLLPPVVAAPPATVPPPATPSTVVTPLGHAKYRLPPIHREGHQFIAIAGGLALLTGPVLGLHTLGWLLAGLTLWIIAFFRDPERVTPVGDDVIVSPADGMVCQIADVSPPRQLIGEHGVGAGPLRRVSIFMNVFDVHVNRTPVAGIVRRIAYVPGKFLNADLDKASEDNERQYFIVETAAGERIGFTQIAGLVARRIVRFVEEGERLATGERVGLIRFGSRVDVYLPAGWSSAVLPGQRTIAGETVLARRDTAAPAAGVAG